MDAPTRNPVVGIVAVLAAISGGLWWFGVLPWWGALLAVPAAVAVLSGLALVFFALAWMAGGSH